VGAGLRGIVMGTGENPKHSPYSPALTPTLWISVEGKQPTDRAMLGQAKPSAPVPSPPPETPGVFHAEQLTKTYRMGDVEVQALRSVDLDLYEGEFVVLLGPSGSGKSTLLNILGGLDIPTSGQVIFRNQNLTQATERRLTQFRRESVGFIFQFYNLIPSLTARENVALVTEIARRPLSPEAALEIVGLRDRLDHFPAQLSGGNSSGWPLRGRSPNVPKCCSAMNPPEPWTSAPASWCSRPYSR
jgi:ABC-type glutathione transport system ATPase component